MAAARIVETVDVFEDGDFGITTRSPGSLPQQLGFYGFEECFNGRMVMKITKCSSVETVFK